MDLIQRTLKKRLLDDLKFFPAIYINGPRQAGKTTLVKNLLHPHYQGEYMSFDLALVRAAATRNPQLFLEKSGHPLIIDEAQRVPELFRALKSQIDEKRLQALDKKTTYTGDYILTGSTNLMAQPALADAMVGRMITRTLLPLSSAELVGATSRFIDRCFSSDFTGIKAKHSLTLLEAMSKSTFPQITTLPDHAVGSWFNEYTEKITLEDPNQIYRLEKAEYMPLLIQSLAHRAGSLLNDANLSREIGLNTTTTSNYRKLLENTFVTCTLKPWYRNLNKRLTKSPKLYFYDTMLLCHLMNTTPNNLMVSYPHRFGHVLENYVLSELLKSNNTEDHPVKISYYRTHDNHEVDFVLEKQHQCVAIEVKHAEFITQNDIKGMLAFKQNAGSDFRCGIVLCNTPQVLAFTEDIS